MTPPTLKPGWKTVKFGDVVSLNRDRVADPAAEGIERYVGLEHIIPEDLRIRSWGLVAEGTTFTNYFQPGQVLFGKRRAYQRKVAVADFDGVCSGDIYVLEPKDPAVLLPELLPFICQTEGFFEHAVGTSAGSLSPRTNWKQLSKYEFPLPSLDEQRRIASSLEELTNTQNLYREAYVKANTLIVSMFNHLSEIEDMREVNITDLGHGNEQVLKTGPFGSKLKTDYFRESGIPIISIGALQDMGLDESEFFFLDPIYEAEFETYKTRVGDIVFSRVADVGRCHLITEKDAGFIISSNLIRIRIDQEKIHPKYLWLLLKYSFKVRREIGRFTTQAAGRLLVNTKTMKELTFDIPDMEYQEYVIARYEEVFSALSALEVRENTISNIAQSLREKALHKGV